MLRQLVLTGLMLGTLAGAGLPAAEKPSPLGRQVENFQLQDYRGKEFSLADYQSSELVVLAFLGTECPLARLYGPQLQQLAAKYPKVQFLGINANRQDSITEIAASVRDLKLEFPMLKDTGNRVADLVGAVRTPEVFVLDKERKIRYWGRIDDQYGIGYIREQANRQDLKAALDELLAGQEVSTPHAESIGCYIGRVRRADEQSDVTYSNQISRIMQQHCVECHREGEIAPFSLIDYEEVVGWIDTIGEVIRENRMPPWHADPKVGHFANERGMTSEEKELLLKWVAAGAPQGDPGQLPAPREFPGGGWQMVEKPDVVFNMAEKPFQVPAEGTVQYQYFSVPTNFTEDKWVRGIEVIPGNRAVVHHVLVMERPPGGERINFRSGFLGAYVPGLRAEMFPKGVAKKIPKGSELIFQVHYTPIGTPQEDLSKIGLVFSEPEEVTHVLVTNMAAQNRFEIPPHDPNYRVEATSRAYNDDVTLVAFSPHMHVRGKSFSFEALYPDGKREMLLNIPAYDFNWQTTYKMAQGKNLPAGTKLHCVAHFDNSADNLANPDPTKAVRWGDQTWEEMMIGYYHLAVPVEKVEKVFGVEAKAPVDRAERTVSQLMQRVDANGDGRIELKEVPEQHQAIFKMGDKDGNGIVTREELLEAVRKFQR